MHDDSPKNATLEVDQRFQSVRIVAVYETDQIPLLPKSGVRVILSGSTR